MRLVHITTVPQSLFFFRGQISWLHGKDVEVEVISSPGAELDTLHVMDGLTTHAVTMLRRISPLRDIVACFRIWRLLRRLRPDVLHASTPKAALLGMTAGFLARVPVRIFHVFGLPHLEARLLNRAALTVSTWASYKLANRVFCVSASMAEIVNRSGQQAKSFVPAHGSPDGIDAQSHFHPERHDQHARRAFRQALSIPAGASIVLFAGRIVREKGIGELAAAWVRLEQAHPLAHLLIAGNREGHDPLPHDVDQMLASSTRIRFAGFLQDPSLAYSCADLLVLPSYREGLGLVLLEAAAMNLPVVATNVPGCVDAVADGVTGTLVPPRNVPALIHAIDAYLKDANLRAQHGSMGRQRVLERFQPEQVRAQTFAEYHRLVRKHFRQTGSATKRVADIVASALLLATLWPLLLALALILRSKLGSPVLFVQRRPGRDALPFEMYKFRTMTNERGADGTLLPDHLRLTRLGRFLRATSLDELPELWNVLKGDMSLVGPRPLLMEYLPLYSEEQSRRHCVKPGITGWAQINGRNTSSWDMRLAMDVWYVDNRSFRLDVLILFRTLQIVLRRDGIAHPGHATMPLFSGAAKQGGHD